MCSVEILKIILLTTNEILLGAVCLLVRVAAPPGSRVVRPMAGSEEQRRYRAVVWVVCLILRSLVLTAARKYRWSERIVLTSGGVYRLSVRILFSNREEVYSNWKESFYVETDIPGWDQEVLFSLNLGSMLSIWRASD